MDSVLGLQVVDRDFYARDVRVVAPELLNKILLMDDGRSGRIIEVEAYHGADDPAAHSYRGKTARNATMFGPAGHMYVYFTYGMHWCCNAVCGDVGEGTGVLIRALTPLTGLPLMREARPKARRDADLCSGPARLTQAFGITRQHDGADLVTGDRQVRIVTDGMPPPARLQATPRIGISQGKDALLRWVVPKDSPS
jgi:DNA-3-methyladenine glycosylase